MFSTSREVGLGRTFPFLSVVSDPSVLPFCSPLRLLGPDWSPGGHTLSPVPSEGFYILSARQQGGGLMVPQEAGRGETHTLYASGANWKGVCDKACVRARTQSALISAEMLFRPLQRSVGLTQPELQIHLAALGQTVTLTPSQPRVSVLLLILLFIYHSPLISVLVNKSIYQLCGGVISSGCFETYADPSTHGCRS